jgi:hypothetical protein
MKKTQKIKYDKKREGGKNKDLCFVGSCLESCHP